MEAQGAFTGMLFTTPTNTPLPSVGGVSGIMFIDVNLLHEEKALFPIDVTEFGMVNEPVKPLQPRKAYSPMLVTEFGRVSEPVKPLQL